MQNLVNSDVKLVETAERKLFRYAYWAASVIFIIWGFVDFSRYDVSFLGLDIYNSPRHDEPSEFHFFTLLLIILIIAFIVVFPFIYKNLQIMFCKNIFLSVTSEKVEGCYYKYGVYKKNYTFPIEQIDNIVTHDGLFDRIRSGKTLVLYTSSSKIRLSFLQNAEEVSTVILDSVKQYKENYGNVKPTVNAEVINNNDEADKIKKYKDLLDSGAITQEEFDLKKKELLGL